MKTWHDCFEFFILLSDSCSNNISVVLRKFADQFLHNYYKLIKIVMIMITTVLDCTALLTMVPCINQEPVVQRIRIKLSTGRRLSALYDLKYSEFISWRRSYPVDSYSVIETSYSRTQSINKV